jgi:hypothetical protein
VNQTLKKLNALVGDLGISLEGASILPGDRLGVYKAMADGGKADIPSLCRLLTPTETFGPSDTPIKWA